MDLGGSHFVKENHLADLLPTLERFPFFVFAIRVLTTSFEFTIAARDEKWPERVRRPGAQNGVFPWENSRSARPRAITAFADSTKRLYRSSVLCEERFGARPRNPGIDHFAIVQDSTGAFERRSTIIQIPNRGLDHY